MAEALLARHLQESWPKPQESTRWFMGGESPARYHENLRTVAVVGAGASIPRMSVADDLAKEVEEELDKDKQEREIELDRLENVYGLKRGSFETRLTAICRTPETERKVRERISKSYRHHHPSLLTYELLAHLLHHRYLDTIISFNFDELLDRSIEDELGAGEYTRVVTEGDIDPGQETPNPLYIKMHGTAAEPDSLRFTRERYYSTPSSIIELVEDQFAVEHLVLINLGFTMASFDFQHLLRKPKNLEIFHLDPKPLKAEVIHAIKQQRCKARERKETARAEHYDAPEVAQFPVTGEGAANADFLDNLVGESLERLEALCDSPGSGPASWRSTLRHRAVVELLVDADINDDDDYTNYLRRRTILEIAFSAAKGRGVVSITAMVKDRCGRYYDLYRRLADDRAEAWSKLCEAGGLCESKEMPDAYELLPSLRAASGESNPATPSIHQAKLADAEALAKHTAMSLDLGGRDREKSIELLTRTIEFLQNDTDIEIHSRDDRVCSKLFAEPLPLKTITALQGWTLEMLKSETDTDYDQLWVVAETGGWLANPDLAEILEEDCEEVRLISAFDAELNLPERVNLDTRRLPWNRHNRHMTIVCSQGKPRAAIYFVRRLRAATVTPVYLSNQRDLTRVTRAFELLWDEAGSYEETLPGALKAPVAS